jgi:hypothetical protein
VVDRISKISFDRPIIEDDGSLTAQSRVYFQTLTNRALIVGTGSPEGVVVAVQGTTYMNDSGATGAIMYIKRDADDGAGDQSIGWILV